MKYSLIAAAIFTGLAAAQSTIPECAQPCLNAAIPKVTTCALDDLKCQCDAANKAAIQAEATTCVISACGDKAVDVLTAAEADCAALGSGSASTTAAESSTSTTAAATSAAASSTTTTAEATTSAAASTTLATSAASSSAAAATTSASKAASSASAAASSSAATVPTGAASKNMVSVGGAMVFGLAVFAGL